MKKYLFILLSLLLGAITNIMAQVKIGNNPSTVNSGSLLELESTNKGLLLPRLADTTSISNPPQGMLMFSNVDTSLYFRRNLGGWQRLAIGFDNYWKALLLEGSNKPGAIFSELPVLVNRPSTGSFTSLAPFQTTGMYGNTLAAFADGQYDYIQGISLIGNWPGVYFNSYYNNSIHSMAAGNAGNITLDESNNLGGAFQFKLSGYSATANASMPNPPAQMILNNDGKLSLNTGSVPTRAWFEQHGAVNNACAIFGGEGSGVAIQEHFPSIGFNSYYNGSGYNSIGAGRGGEIGLDQNTGDFYVTTMNSLAIAPNLTYPGFVRTFNIAPTGYIGINTTDPSSQIEIEQPNNAIISSNGLRFTSHEDIGGFHYTSSFTISGYTGGSTELNGGQADNFPGAAYLVFQTDHHSGYPTELVANIDDDGDYHEMSDARFKKDIVTLDKNDMLQKLLSLNPRNYHFINERTNAQKSYGFLAQDVEKIFPEFVNEIQGKKMLSYSSFVPVIVSAMQEQQQEIESLKNQNLTPSATVQSENESLKKQVSGLTEMVKQLQQQVNALQEKIK